MTRGLRWVRGWVPPEAIRLFNHWTGRNSRLSGNYRSWEEASRNADGYDAAAILDRAREAMLAIRDGRGAFVRDGVVFPEPNPPLPLLCGLMRVAACAGGHLRVLDFGGALGSTYYQCRKFLQGLPSVRWQVVEQPQFVACGSEVFADGVLGFSSSISEAAHLTNPNVVVLSGVLQYLPNPVAVLEELGSLGAKAIIVDRTPIIVGSREVIAVQRVSSRIVRSSYPVRLFTRAGLLDPLNGRYQLLAEFDAVDGPAGGVLRRIEFKGFLLEAARPQASA